MKMTLLILVGAYVLVCLIAYLAQSRLVYFPSREDAGRPDGIGSGYRDVNFETATGRILHGWLVEVEGAVYTMMYFHGNAGNITHRLHSIRQFVDMGLNVFIVDYAGYGKSQGRPGEAATYEDAVAAWDWLTGDAGVSPDRVILFGRSLGAAVAIDLATRVDARALIAESSFTSMPELGSRVYPWLPVKFIARIRYNNAKKVPHLRIPKLFIHSLDDEIVPFGMGKRLYNKAARPKQFLRIRGSHNDGFVASEPEYEEGVKAFLSSLDQPRIRLDEPSGNP